tara:strand:- start:152 stop:454 length:303 start_codon:yes stop_codon:yes gene_type:complete
MAFKKKPYLKVGVKDWQVIIPRPPAHATHARMTMRDEFYDNGQPKQATLPLQDFGCFKGVAGDFHYLRMDKKGKVAQEWEGTTWFWNGYQVSGIDDLMNE